MVKAPGFARDTLDEAIATFLHPAEADSDDTTVQKSVQQQYEILNQLAAMR